jgi:hypothetical protein
MTSESRNYVPQSAPFFIFVGMMNNLSIFCGASPRKEPNELGESRGKWLIGMRVLGEDCADHELIVGPTECACAARPLGIIKDAPSLIHGL